MKKFIRCEYCNRINNINVKTFNSPIVTGYKCAHCHEKLDIKELQEYKFNTTKLHTVEKNNIVIDTIKLIVIIMVLLYASMKYYDYHNKNDVIVIKDNHSIIENPKSGILLDLINKNKVAPFTIITNGHSNYYVKLKFITNNKKFITIFINKGNEISIKIPLGSYILTYTSGNKWYGTQYLFGKKSIHEVDKILTFTQNERVINGHTITLYNVVNGNLQETIINKNSF